MIDFNETAEAYHANAAIGSGDIRDLLRSPALFRDRQNGLGQRSTPALLFGHASHMALLEPNRYASLVAVKPDGMSFATKEGKAWRAEQAGRLVVSNDDATHLRYMHERMPNEVCRILATGRTEVTVRTELVGVPVQCRIDCWTPDGSVIYDLKSINNIDDIERAVWKHGYFIQDRWYGTVTATATGQKRPAFKFIFAEKLPPYRWRIVQLDVDYQMHGDEMVGRALFDLEERTRTGDWSDPGELHQMVSPPAWMNEDDDEDDTIEGA